MNTETTVLLAPISKLEKLRALLLGWGCNVRGYDDLTSIVVALNVLPLAGLYIDPVALGCDEFQIEGLRARCRENGISRVVIGESGTDFGEVAMFLAGVSENHSVTW